MIGQSIAHYRISAKIGEGGMGEVYQATDTKLQRDVALKVLPKSFTDDEQRLARFTREAQVLASLNHPNIGAIHGIEESDGVRALVLELVEGDTLSDRMQRGPIPLKDALEISLQIAQALQKAHENGIVHRDLKPANVKVTPDGTVKVLDFGLALATEPVGTPKDVSNSPTLTMASFEDGMILGTAAYMSPEQVRGEAVGPQSDIWSFGVLLCEMLNGERLFVGRTVSDVMAAVLTVEIAPLLPSLLPRRVRRLLNRCLQREIDLRLHHFGDVILEIRDALESDERPERLVDARRSSWWVHPGTWVLLAACFMLAAVLSWRGSDQPIPLAPVVRVKLDSKLGWDRVSADGTQFLSFTNTPDDRPLFLRASSETVERPVAGTDAHTYAFFSPDGRQIAFFADSKLKTVPTSEGVIQTLADTTLNPRGAAWLAGGQIVFAPGPNGGLSILSGPGIPPTPLTTLDRDARERSHRWPSALPDGKSVLFAVVFERDSLENAQIEIVDLEGNRRRVDREGSVPSYLPSGHIASVKRDGLFVSPFSAASGETTGPPVLVVPSLIYNALTGFAPYSVSDTGTLIYTGSAPGHESRLRILGFDGSSSDVPLKPDAYHAGVFSPQGDQVAILRGARGEADLYIFDLALETMTRLTHSGDIRNPLWFPDGSRLVVSSVGDGANLNLFWLDLGGTGEMHRLTLSNVPERPVSWTPDGDLLFGVPEGRYLWLLDVEIEDDQVSAKGVRAIREASSVDSASWRGPSLSPDGKWLAYSIIESNEQQLFVQSFPGLDRRFKIPTEGGLNPMWSSTGNQLFFFSGDKLQVIDYSGTESFSASRPRTVLAGVYPFSASTLVPGATGLLVNVLEPDATADTGPSRWLVTNWFEELRGLSGGAPR